MLALLLFSVSRARNPVDLLFHLLLIPEEYNPHPLKGNWKNFMECHVKNDTLLIWFDKENDKIELVRLGSHSELFGKGRKR